MNGGRRRRFAGLLAALAAGALLAAPADAAKRRKGARKPAKAAAKTVKMAPAAAGPTGPARFKVSTPTLSQQLDIAPGGPAAVNFILAITGDCQRTVTGLARSEGREVARDQDEFGIAYAVTEYRHIAPDGCYFALRIDSAAARRAMVVQSDCQHTCPPVEGLMFRMKK